MIAAIEHHNRGIARQNCLAFLKLNEERMTHFARRIIERGMTPQEVVITCIQVDDNFGGLLADALMPGHDWQPIRDQGQEPCARGLAARAPIEELLLKSHPEAGKTLEATDSYTIVLVDVGSSSVRRVDFRTLSSDPVGV